MKRKILSAALAAMPWMALAAADVKTLDAVVVTGQSTAEQFRGSTPDGASLATQRAASSDTANLLRDIPGVSLYGAGGVSSLPAIHGLADDRLRIKVDGMDLISACANHMNSPLSYIDPSSVGSVNVFAGVAPVSSGGDSIGGTILVDSADPEFARPGQGPLLKGEAGLFYRSNGNAQGGNLAATIAGEKLSMSYQGSTAKADNYKAGGDFKAVYTDKDDRHTVAADEVGSSMYQSHNQSLKFALRHENHQVELKYGMQDIPYQGWPNQRMDMTANDSTQINLRYKGTFGWGKLDARAYDEHTRHKMQFYDDKLFWYGPTVATDGVAGPIVYGAAGRAAGMPMDTEGRNTGIVIKGDLVLSARDLLRLGGETQRYRLDDWWDPSGKGMGPSVFWNIRNGERDRLALFGEWEAQWNPQWLTQLGLRHEKVDMNTGAVQGYSAAYNNAGRTAPPLPPGDDVVFNTADRKKSDNNVDFTALARYEPSATGSYEFGFAQKTRSPNLYERYAWSQHGMSMRMVNWAGDGNGYVGNLNLEPEVAHTLSATFDWHDATREHWGLKVTPYLTYVRDYIDAARCDSTPDGNACKNANLTASNAFVYLQFVNQSARLRGIDISGYFPLAKTQGLGSFTVNGKLNYTRGENRSTGDNLYNIMPLNAKLALVQKLGGWTGTLEVDMVSAKDQLSQVRNEMKTAGYGLAHLRGSYEWKQLRFDIGVENLFDRHYFHPLGGAYAGEGKTMSGTDVPWGLGVPGAGRSVYVGANVKF